MQHLINFVIISTFSKFSGAFFLKTQNSAKWKHKCESDKLSKGDFKEAFMNLEKLTLYLKVNMYFLCYELLKWIKHTNKIVNKTKFYNFEGITL